MSNPEVRIGDSERDAAVSALGEHYAAGRLTKDEYDERVGQAWKARTTSGLSPLFMDLPAPHGAPVAQRPASGRTARTMTGSAPSRPPFWSTIPLFPVFLVLFALALFTHFPWFVLLIFMFLWFSGVFHGLRRWGRRR